MRILHIIGATVAGGAERVVVDLTRHLAGRGHEVAVMALSGRVDDAGVAMRRQLAAAGVAIYLGPAGPVRFGAVFRLVRVLKLLQPDIVHLHTANTELALALASFAVGRHAVVARTVHSVSLPRSTLYRWAYRRNGVQLSAACSAAAAEANADCVSPILVVQNGVTFDWAKQTPDNRMRARADLGLNPDKRHYLGVGSMRGVSPGQAPKAHDVIIAAWKQFAHGRSDSELHLVGDGNLRAQLESKAAIDPSIHFHGVSSRISDWLQAADVFVMPSRYEGLPIAGLEALGTGLPVIFSQIPSLLELAPQSALWVPSNDVTALASAFQAAAVSQLHGSDEDAERIRRDFGIERMADEYLSYYEQSVARPA